MANYQPPYSCLHLLGTVAGVFASGRVAQLNQAFNGATFVGTFPGGQLFFESNLKLDADGSIYYEQDKTVDKQGRIHQLGQAGTSLPAGHGKGVDASAIPYIVLPKNSFGHWGIQLGDLAMVLYNGRMSPAIFADHGPESELGEGSIELHRRLGNETIHNGKLKINQDIRGRVLTFVFPHSGNHKAQPMNAIEAVARRCWYDMTIRAGGTYLRPA
jgi:hypothetical protein